MQSKTTAKDFFLYLGVIIGLYVSVISFLVLAFAIIDKVFPLVGEYVYNPDAGIRSPLAALIIFFPAFLYVLSITNKDLASNPDKKDFWVRKWAIFLTLFIAGLTIAIDLTTLVYRFLGAEDLSVRFFLKVFTVLITAGVVFYSSLHDLKRENFQMDKGDKTRLYSVSAVILLIVIYAISLIGSPATQRARTLDDQRVNDLMSIQNQIVYTHWTNKGTVPANLDILKDPISSYALPTDPETKQSYAYKMISKNSFELCANFTTINNTKNLETRMLKPAYINAVDENWQHEATTTCFTRTIDPTLYKVSPTPVKQ